MKAPQNFAQRVDGHIINGSKYKYRLAADTSIGNEVWIYPHNSGDSANIIRMDFNWQKGYYVINIAKYGDGTNFHTTLPAFDFVRTSQFLSLGAFNSWMIAKLEDFHKYFGHK